MSKEDRDRMITTLNVAIGEGASIHFIFSSEDKIGNHFLSPDVLIVHSTYKWPFPGNLSEGFTMHILIPLNDYFWGYYNFTSMMWFKIQNPKFKFEDEDKDVRVLTFVSNGKEESIPI